MKNRTEIEKKIREIEEGAIPDSEGVVGQTYIGAYAGFFCLLIAHYVHTLTEPTLNYRFIGGIFQTPSSMQRGVGVKGQPGLTWMNTWKQTLNRKPTLRRLGVNPLIL